MRRNGKGMVMGKFEAFDIEYDTDGESVADLPEVVGFEADDIEQAREIAADKVSDETGWLVASLEVREA
jgi:hypothetical protein